MKSIKNIVAIIILLLVSQTSSAFRTMTQEELNTQWNHNNAHQLFTGMYSTMGSCCIPYEPIEAHTKLKIKRGGKFVTVGSQVDFLAKKHSRFKRHIEAFLTFASLQDRSVEFLVETVFERTKRPSMKFQDFQRKWLLANPTVYPF